MRDSSFLPEDYLAQKAERRTNIICLTLFALVMTSIFGVFLLSTRQRASVSAMEAALSAEVQQAADEIEKVTELHEQRTEMIEKAEIAAALVERVPRSILLAEIVNRMPSSLTLTEFDMKSKKIVLKAIDDEDDTDRRKRGPKRARTKAEAAELASEKVQAPRYKVELSLTGVGPNDKDVSDFIESLAESRLLTDVSLVYSEDTKLNEVVMREFHATMRLRPNADVRHIEPIRIQRGSSPMGGPWGRPMFDGDDQGATVERTAPQRDDGRSWNPLRAFGKGGD